ncbi:MAG: phosphate ABC transporter substrate-binding protein [Leptolyngbyaceae cyanobacterium CSU_1_3]|nr:phosphate ABC transporter substrate-binding protein [Leptolyngbyaceae cyanobacterium CSU_1_3]
MLQKKDPSILNNLALLVALATTAPPIAASLTGTPVLGQAVSPAPTFSLPTTVPKGATIRIDGSSSMAAVNQALKQRFETQFPGTAVTTNAAGIPAALKALIDGQVDIVGIGRSLTAEEKAQGLVAVPVGREKIAIVVSPENPFSKSLTIQQFAKIFRGEITNWSEVGGAPGAIRVIDRTEISDTRQAFRNYPAFKGAEFKTGTTAKALPDDSTGSVIPQLGTDGIGYAIANQARDTPGIRPLLMHNTLPTDPRYPFSQPLAYVYKGTPSPAVSAFLGYATAPNGQQIIQEAKADQGAIAAGSASAAGAAALSLNVPAGGVPAGGAPAGGAPVAEATASPEAVASPVPIVAPTVAAAPNGTASPTTPSPTVAPNGAIAPSPGSATGVATSRAEMGGIPPWLWLLPLGLFGLLLWWLFGKRGAEDETIAPTAQPAPPP